MFLKIYAGVMTFITVLFGGMLFSPTDLPPIHDLGHRVYGIADEQARDIVRGLFAQFGLKEAFTFDLPPTHQTLFDDGFTVLNVTDKNNGWAEYPASAISLVVADPAGGALSAVKYLRDAHYEADFKEMLLPDGMPPIYVIKSTAFGDWSLVLRRHAWKLGSPPKR